MSVPKLSLYLIANSFQNAISCADSSIMFLFTLQKQSSTARRTAADAGMTQTDVYIEQKVCVCACVCVCVLVCVCFGVCV